jgi:hypothetical protein
LSISLKASSVSTGSISIDNTMYGTC